MDDIGTAMYTKPIHGGWYPTKSVGILILVTLLLLSFVALTSYQEVSYYMSNKYKRFKKTLKRAALTQEPNGYHKEQ